MTHGSRNRCWSPRRLAASDASVVPWSKAPVESLLAGDGYRMKNQIAQDAVLEQQPKLEPAARQALAAQDALLVAERLQAWTDAALATDLEGYPGLDPARAGEIRDRLLLWLKTPADRGEGSDG